MASGGPNIVAMKMATRSGDDLATLFGVGAVGRLPDAELLARFVQRQDAASSEAAFAALVARHGPMVLGVCRRMLGDDHGAADAFQAVFVVLARKAAVVRVDDSLGRWLYCVSVRVARKRFNECGASVVKGGRKFTVGGASPARLAHIWSRITKVADRSG